VTTTPPTAPPTTPPATPPKLTGTVTPTVTPATPSYIAPPVDWSKNGNNWVDDLCVTGGFQSPINIETKSTKESNKVKFAFDFKSYENLTLELNDLAGQLSVNLSDYSRFNSLNLWNEKGEHFKYFLEGYQWKVPSEHTIDNR
jgi:carbonic anhydrase